METFTFTYSSNDGEGGYVSSNQSFSGDCLTHVDVAEKFTRFLRGVGYVFDEMLTLRLVDDMTGEVRPY